MSDTEETMDNTAPTAPAGDARKERYARTKKENEDRKRARRREEADSGAKGLRRLAFLVDIYTSLGYTQSGFADKCGMSRQLLNWYLSVTDDCHLTRLEDMLSALGLGVTVRIETPDKDKVSKSVAQGKRRFRLEGSFAGVTAKPDYPDWLLECAEDRRLHFLREFIESTHLSVPALCRRCGIDPTTMKYYFGRDNLRLSVLYGIAESFDAEIVWSVNPKNV